MKHSQFKIGREFFMSVHRWRCTDVGTRTATAIRLDQPDDSWYNGPPYTIIEHVIDECDMQNCDSIGLTLQLIAQVMRGLSCGTTESRRVADKNMTHSVVTGENGSSGSQEKSKD